LSAVKSHSIAASIVREPFIGAPKQERWMAGHKGRVKAVQLGVGAAFDFIVGDIKQAPLWMQRMPLEWLHRMPQQPRKTFLRMLVVPKFFFLTFLQVVREGRAHSKS
jgi:N-acetylglucosaminyldiphosphoundecaprenol N-acetyl-beta-D-mannosaminyltransferase